MTPRTMGQTGRTVTSPIRRDGRIQNPLFRQEARQRSPSGPAGTSPHNRPNIRPQSCYRSTLVQNVACNPGGAHIRPSLGNRSTGSAVRLGREAPPRAVSRRMSGLFDLRPRASRQFSETSCSVATMRFWSPVDWPSRRILGTMLRSPTSRSSLSGSPRVGAIGTATHGRPRARYPTSDPVSSARRDRTAAG